MNYFLITDTAELLRLTRTGDKESYPLSPERTGLKCQIMPASADILAVYPGEPSYQLYEIFTYDMGLIKNGDKLKAPNADYIVRGEPQKVDTALLKYQRIVGEKVV